MTRDKVWNRLRTNICDVLSGSATVEFSQKDSLRNIGANSVDRAEIIMLTQAQLKLRIPLIHFASATNIDELVDIFYDHIQSQTQEK